MKGEKSMHINTITAIQIEGNLLASDMTSLLSSVYATIEPHEVRTLTLDRQYTTSNNRLLFPLRGK
jgi:hypothetical protein